MNKSSPTKKIPRFAINLQSRLREANLSIAGLARHLGVSHSFVFDMCIGGRPVPDKHVRAISVYLDAPLIRRRKPRENECRVHYKPLPCVSCALVGERVRQQWQTMQRRERARRARQANPFYWSDEELQILRDMSGHYSAHEIAATINAHRANIELPPRTPAAVKQRARRGRYACLIRVPLSREEVSRIFGVNYNTLRRWHELGYLHARSWGAKHIVYDEDELQRLARENPWLFDVARVALRDLRDIASLAMRRDPWLRLDEARKLARCSARVIEHAIRDGRAEIRQRPGYHGTIFVRASSVPVLREAARRAHGSAA